MKKRYLILPLFTLLLASNVQAITSNDVTYDNNGTEENLTTTLDNLYSELNKYKTGGSVAASQMLEGATGYSKGELVTGTIKSKAAQTYTPGTSNQTIDAGQYLSGAQTIKGDANLVAANIAAGKSIFGVAGTYTSDATATAGNILSGKTAYVNGSKVTGTIGSKAATTYTPGTTNQTIAAGQYLSGAQTIKGDADLKAANILSGVNIFGVNGAHTAQSHQAGVNETVHWMNMSGHILCENSYTFPADGWLVVNYGAATPAGNLASKWTYYVSIDGVRQNPYGPATIGGAPYQDGHLFYHLQVKKGQTIKTYNEITDLGQTVTLSSSVFFVV